MLDHPLVPGPSSAVEKGPWHYGADYVTVYFRGEAARLRELVPPQFEVVDGDSMAYVCEIVSVGDSGADMVATRPDRTVYQEAAIGVKCRHGTKAGIFFPVMWVTTEWSLLRGILNGYQKRLADRISMTRLHPLNPKLKGVAPGSRFGGFCVKGPEETLSLEVTVQRPGAPSDLPSFGSTFGLRKFPGTEGSQGTVEEAVEVMKSNARTSDVWVGSGSLQTVLDLGEVKQTSGAVYRSGFTISGARPLR
ncbi:MAG: acetoacetate decarboxylase family protein [Nitrososphaerota archaeon]|nr:acetoacetate decarboxylase family protein [Nitrososphaerota archaeon]